MEQTNRITPFLCFKGNAQEAMEFYMEALPGAKIEALTRFGAGQGGPEGGVLNGTLSFLGQTLFFMDMDDSALLPPFSWAMSLYVACSSEQEFDSVFAGLSQGGTVMMGPEPVMDLRKVAWVTDRFGVTWQPVWA